MKNDKLIDAIGRVDEVWIHEAEIATPRMQPSAMERFWTWLTFGYTGWSHAGRVRAGALAVCAVIMVVVGITAHQIRQGHQKSADMTAQESYEATGWPAEEEKAVEEETSTAAEEALPAEENKEEMPMEEPEEAREEAAEAEEEIEEAWEEEAPAEEEAIEEEVIEEEEAEEAEEEDEADEEGLADNYFYLETDNTHLVLSLYPDEEQIDIMYLTLDESRTVLLGNLEDKEVSAVLQIPADEPTEEIPLEIIDNKIQIPEGDGRPAMLKLSITINGETIERSVYVDEEEN